MRSGLIGVGLVLIWFSLPGCQNDRTPVSDHQKDPEKSLLTSVNSSESQEKVPVRGNHELPAPDPIPKEEGVEKQMPSEGNSEEGNSSPISVPSEKTPLTKILVPERRFLLEGPNKALRVSYDDLDIEKVLGVKQAFLGIQDQFPKWLTDLNGKRIRLRGYMRTIEQSEDIDRFILCRDTSACCFGPDPIIYYIVPISMKSGVTTDFIDNRAFDVEGDFHIDVQALEDGSLFAFYYIDEAIIVKR